MTSSGMIGNEDKKHIANALKVSFQQNVETAQWNQGFNDEICIKYNIRFYYVFVQGMSCFVARFEARCLMVLEAERPALPVQEI